MECRIVSYSYGVEGLQAIGDEWLFGILSKPSVEKSPLAPWINIAKAINRSIRESKELKERRLPTLAGMLVPLISQGGFIREVPDQCLIDFFSITEDDAGGMKAFIRQYGLFDLEHLFTPANQQPRDVRKLWIAAEESSRIPFAFHVSEFWAERTELDKLQEIWTTVQDGKADQHNTVRLSEETGENYVQNFDPWKYDTWDEAMQSLLLAVMTGRLANARAILKEDGGKLIPTLVTSCVKDALSLRLLEKIGENTPLGRCMRCGRPFVAIKKTKQYCSAKCQSMAKRYRQLKKPADYHSQPDAAGVTDKDLPRV